MQHEIENEILVLDNPNTSCLNDHECSCKYPTLGYDYKKIFIVILITLEFIKLQKRSQTLCQGD